MRERGEGEGPTGWHEQSAGEQIPAVCATKLQLIAGGATNVRSV